MVKMKTILLMLAGFASTVLMMPQISAYAQSPSYKHIFNIYASGPHIDMAAAKAELQRAKLCGIEGYTKRATYLGGE